MAARNELERSVQRYADFHWEHMGREEGVILPAAQQYLTAQDWESINGAFLEDPQLRLGGEADMEYNQLIARIVRLAADGTAG